MTEQPLDPDEVTCPRCGAGPAVPCQTPAGRKARTIHTERRRAATQTDHDRPTTEQPSTRRKAKARPGQAPPPASRESRAKGGRKASQDRKRRRAEQEAAIAAAEEEALREEARANAVRHAEDAVRFANDRALLRRQTLDAARKAAERLLEGLDGFQRIQVDEEGVIQTEPRESWRGDRRRVEDVPIVRGWASAETLERLAKVAASTLNSLRLEEGKPTTHTRTSGDADELESAGVEELIEWAAQNLPRE